MNNLDSLWNDPDDLWLDPEPEVIQEPIDVLLDEFISLWQLRAQIKRALEEGPCAPQEESHED